MLNLKKYRIRFNITAPFIYLCAALITAAALFLLYAEIGVSFREQMAELFAQIDIMEQELLNKQENLRNNDAHIRLTEELKETGVPREIYKTEEPIALINILNQAREHKLNDREITVRPRTNANGARLLRPVTIGVYGAFSDCMRFMHKVKRDRYYYLINAAKMYASGEGIYDMSLEIYLVINDKDMRGKTDDIIRPARQDLIIKNPFVYRGM